MKFLVRYGEIGLKSKSVRRRFENVLERRILERFAVAGKDCVVEREQGRVFVYTPDRETGETCLARVFGVVSFSPVEETSSSPEDIFAKAVSLCRQRPGGSFAVRCRRSGEHTFTSNEIAAAAGSAILEDFQSRDIPLSVNLKNPDWDISIEVRQNRAYLFNTIIRGNGGFPLGTQGKAAFIIEDDCDVESTVAAGWLMMKRGCLTFPFIHEIDRGDPGCRELQEKANRVVEILKVWDPDIRMDEPTGQGVSSDGQEDSPGLEDFMRKHRLTAVVRALGVNHFREDKMALTGQYPEIYPIIGMDDGDLKELVEKISV